VVFEFLFWKTITLLHQPSLFILFFWLQYCFGIYLRKISKSNFPTFSVKDNLMMIHRLAIVSVFAVLNVLAFPYKSEAQATTDVNFNVNITATIAIQVGSPDNPTPSMGFTPPSPTSGEAQLTGTTDLIMSCTTAAFISVSAPQRIGAPSGFDDTFRKARIRSGNRMTTAEVGNSTGFPDWRDSAPAPLNISSCTSEPLVVEMVAGGANGLILPTGNYIYKVTVTATPQ
jgi:hypothetical protein